MKKIIGTALLATALVTSSIAPFSAATTVQAATKTQIKTDYKALKTTSLYSATSLKKVAVKIPKNQYIQVTKKVKINGVSYYKVKFTNYNADLKDLLWGEIDDTVVYTGYVKASHVKAIKNRYGTYKKLNRIDDLGIVEQYTPTKAYNLRLNYRLGITQTENNVIDNDTRVIILGKRNINGKTYVKVADAGYREYVGYMPKSLLKKLPLNATKTYSKATQKTPYITTGPTDLLPNYGSSEYFAENEPLEKGTAVYMLKEVTYQGKVYVYVNLKGTKNYGWVRGHKLMKK